MPTPDRASRTAIEILLVEDSPTDAFLAGSALGEASVPVSLHVARNGQQALEFVARRGEFGDAPRPDLILLDLDLPRVSGCEVLQRIKDDPATRAIPVIVLSSSTDERDVARAYDLHANGYVPKPADYDSFAHVVRRIERFWLGVAELPPRR